VSKGVSLELTADSKRILATWAKDKTGKVDRIIDLWLIRILAWMLRETMQAFDKGEQPGGAPWPPNVGTYAAHKASLGKNKPGIFSGALRRSPAQNKSINKTQKEAKIGSPLPYAPFIFYGTKTAPAFPYFPTVQHGEKYARTLFNELVRKHLA